MTSATLIYSPPTLMRFPPKKGVNSVPPILLVLDTTQCSLFIITQEFKPLMPAQTPANVVPPDLLVSLEEVSSDLHKLSTHKPWDQMEYRTNCYSNLHPN